MDEEVPDGAAVFPLIPAELGVHPLLLATLHAVVFLDGSEPEIVNADAATEALEYLAGYLQRLEGKDLIRLREDMATLAAFARQEKWPKPLARFVAEFLGTYGVDADEEEDS